MGLFTLDDEPGTMLETHFALQLTISAGFGALHEVLVVLIVGSSKTHGVETKGERGDRRTEKDS